MKIIGILLLLLGLFLMVAGIGAAIFFYTNSGPSFACDIAARDKKDADTAEAQWQAARGGADETTLKTTYEAAKRTAYVSENECSEMKTQQKVFTITGGVVGAVGFLLMLAGIGGFIFGRKRAAAK